MKNIFCVKEQAVTEHKASLSPDGEFVFTCQSEVTPAEVDDKGKVIKKAILCGRFVKFPANTEDLNEAVKAHELANVGQVTVEEQEKKLADFLKANE